jgi:catechol 2,3-dioxygenase-like lactoylglutathione lyase family enzyme
MDVLSVNHIALVVADVDRARQFYAEVLGLEEIPRPASFTFPGAWMRRRGFEIHLIGEAETGRAATLQPSYYERELRRGYLPHLAFEVADLETTRARLAQLDIMIVGGPQYRGDDVVQLYIRDPDGNVIELFDRSAA